MSVRFFRGGGGGGGLIRVCEKRCKITNHVIFEVRPHFGLLRTTILSGTTGSPQVPCAEIHGNLTQAPKLLHLLVWVCVCRQKGLHVDRLQAVEVDCVGDSTSRWSVLVL